MDIARLDRIEARAEQLRANGLSCAKSLDEAAQEDGWRGFGHAMWDLKYKHPGHAPKMTPEEELENLVLREKVIAITRAQDQIEAEQEDEDE